MSTNRRRKRESQRGFSALGDLCAKFYHFLGSKPQPSDEAVRNEFIRLRTLWVNYCIKKGYDKKTKDEFTRQVAIVWNSQKEKTQSTTEKETQPSSQGGTNSGTNT